MASQRSPLDRADKLLRDLAGRTGNATEPDELSERAEAVVWNAEARLREVATDIAQYRSAFEATLFDTWSDAFCWLDLATAYVGSARSIVSSPKTSTAPEPVRHALWDLCGRTVEVSAEVIALLRAGLIHGAHARWRTLYELAVTTRVLTQGNRHTATRFLEHHTIAYTRLGDLLPDRQATAKDVERLKKRFGSPFGGQYGWAAELTKRRLGTSNPKFSDLEALADLNWLNPMYRLAHHHVHGGPLGNVLGQPDGGRSAIADPFNLSYVVRAAVNASVEVGATAVLATDRYRVESASLLRGFHALGEELGRMGLEGADPPLTLDTFDVRLEELVRNLAGSPG